MAHPLRTIIARPSYSEETLECGHTIRRPLGLGEPSEGQRRRCYKCGDMPAAPKPARKRGAPAQARGLCPSCGKFGLGNTYSGRSVSLNINGSYRCCRYCGEHSPL